MDLTGKDKKSMKDIEEAFHALNLCPQEGNEEKSNGRKDSDSDMSDDLEVNPRFKTLVEEREYDTIPGSATATQISLSH